MSYFSKNARNRPLTPERQRWIVALAGEIFDLSRDLRVLDKLAADCLSDARLAHLWPDDAVGLAVSEAMIRVSQRTD